MSVDNKKKIFQSASRNDTFQTCSALYAAKYLWKIPDLGNDGANRGSVAHEILEILANPRHRKIYEEAVHTQSCQEVPALWRTVKRIAKRFGVDDPTNLKMIDGFIIVGLMNEFFGPKGTVKIETEKEFTLEVDEDGKRYNARGYIDKTFLIKDKSGERLESLDFKSSKTRFSGEKETFNTQNILYLLALKRLYPHITNRRFRFLFLKFPKSPWQEMAALTDDQLDGYEYLLTNMQEQLESFSEKNMMDNLAATREDVRWLCGKEMIKKDGTPAWVCPARRPLDYWVVLDGEGAIIRSAFAEEGLKAKKGERVEQKKWAGCPFYYTPKGQKISQ